MPFDGITTACVTKELAGLLIGAKIEKIYQPTPEELIFQLHGDRKKHKLLLSAAGSHARMHLIEATVSNPADPPGFCMLLRKHLQGGRIREFYQKDTERIVEIAVDSLDEMGFRVHKKLIVEIMGKHSNISLVEIETGKILDSIKRVRAEVNRYRQLLPGLRYIYPSSGEKVPFWHVSGAEHLESLLRENPESDLSAALVGHIQGISPFFARLLCHKADIVSHTPVSDLSAGAYASLFMSFSSVLQKIETGTFAPVVYGDADGFPIDYYPFDLGFAEDKAKQHFDTLSLALEYYYESKASSSHLQQKAADLVKVVTVALDKLYLKKKRLLADLEKATDSEPLRLRGELLTAYIHQIEQGKRSITVDNYYDGSKLVIDLDPLLSPSGNIQRYYKKYNKAKTAVKEKSIQLDETDADIHYLESIQTFLSHAQDFNDLIDLRQELVENRYIRKRNEKGNAGKKDKSIKSGLKPYTYTTSDGFRIAVGRNNKQNDMLTLKTASNKDLWLHTKDIPGSHVILFTDGKDPTDTALREAASLAAYHSKGRLSDNVPVDYVTVKHVRKPTGAKYGMVIYDHHQTLYVKPQEIPIS